MENIENPGTDNFRDSSIVKGLVVKHLNDSVYKIKELEDLFKSAVDV